jgi:hypothetical protein
LGPRTENHIGLPVVVSHVQEFGIDRQGQDPLRATLNAGEAGLALIQRLRDGERIPVVGRLVPVNIKAASRFDAVCASRAILAPVDAAELADPVEPAWNYISMNMITIRHIRFLIETMLMKPGKTAASQVYRNSNRPVPSHLRPAIHDHRKGCECPALPAFPSVVSPSPRQ